MDPGVIDTLATGTAVTVTVTVCVVVAAAKLLLPGAVAVTVMVALPGAIAVTTPVVCETVAIVGVVVPYVTVAAGAPLGWLTVEASVAVCPAVSVSALGETVSPVIADGSGATVTVAVPTLPSTTAVTVVVPGAIAVSSPCVEIVATAGAELVHVTARPVWT